MMIPKPKPKRKSSRNSTPQELLVQAYERDEGICQYCGKQGVNIHHILFGGTGRRRIHTVGNLITLCGECHMGVHSNRGMREFTYEWSRKKYGNVIDKLLQEKWSGEK